MSNCRWMMLCLSASLFVLAACGEAEVPGPGHEVIQDPDAGPDMLAADGGGHQDAATRDAAGSDDAAVLDASVDAATDSGPPPPPPPIVVFDPPAGGFVGPTTLTLSAFADAKAPVYYTLDGSLPTEDSPVYTDPITLDDTTLVRALAADASGKLVL